MSESSLFQDAWGVMDPHVLPNHSLGGWRLVFLFLILWPVFLDFSWIILSQPKQTFWNQRRGVSDSCNLRSQVDSFILEEEGVGVKLTIKVSRESMLYLSSINDVLWLQIWKLSPFPKSSIASPVNILVDSAASILHSFDWFFLAFSAGFKASLSYVVVFLLSHNLSPKSELRSSRGVC